MLLNNGVRCRRVAEQQRLELQEQLLKNEQMWLEQLQRSEELEAWKRAAETAIRDKEEAVLCTAHSDSPLHCTVSTAQHSEHSTA